MSRSGFFAPAGFRESPSAALAIGEVIASTYVIQHEIARTDTGVVFEARDMMMDRQIAFKLAWRDPGTPSLLQEARRCAAVRDPCAVAVHGMGTHNGMEYVVGERVTGVLLREQLGTSTPASPGAARLPAGIPGSAAYLTHLQRLVTAIARAHECGIAIGDISGSTVLVDPHGRMVLGRLSLSQVPAFGPHGTILAPEVVRGEVEAGDPAAAEAIDLYGLGCIAIELARGTPPFAAAIPAIELRGHGFEPPPRLGDLRDDVPEEVADLVAWLLAKRARERPRSALDVLAQLDAIIERIGMGHRALRVLIVDDEPGRARWMRSLARRAHPSVVVETATEGTDAAHKLNRDQPDLVFVEGGLRGVMNALELVMYARGLDTERPQHLVLVGEVADRERVVFADARVPVIARDHLLGSAVLDRVRAAVTEPVRRRKKHTTITG